MDDKRLIAILNGARASIRQRSVSEAQRKVLSSYLKSIRGVVVKLKDGRIADRDTLINELNESMRRWGKQLPKDILKISANTINYIKEVHFRATRNYLTDNGYANISFSFEGMRNEAIEAMFRKRGLGLAQRFKSTQTLANRYQIDIDDLLTKATDTGKGFRSVVADIEKKIAIGRGYEQALKDLRDGKIDFRTDAKVQKIIYDAERIARTEIDSAIHEGEIVASERSPVVKALKWQTSSRHSFLSSSPDICDVYEQQDAQGLGAGVYTPATMPAKPHPNCGCTRIYVLREPAEYNQPKEVRQNRLTNQSNVSDILSGSKGNRKLTDRYIQTTTDQANRLMIFADRGDLSETG